MKKITIVKKGVSKKAIAAAFCCAGPMIPIYM